MTGLGAILESFDGIAPVSSGLSKDARNQQQSAEAYAEGYAAGEAAAEARHHIDSSLIQSVAAQLDQLAQENANRFNAELCEALIIAIEKIFPALAAKGFATEASAAIANAATLGSEQTLSVRVHPERVDFVKSALEDIAMGATIDVAADDCLSDLEVQSKWGAAGVDFDFDAAIDESLSLLDKAAKKLRGE